MLAWCVAIDQLYEVGEDALLVGLRLAKVGFMLPPQLVDVPKKRADQTECDLCVMLRLVHVFI